jgi:hypothetical protein
MAGVEFRLALNEVSYFGSRATTLETQSHAREPKVLLLGMPKFNTVVVGPYPNVKAFLGIRHGCLLSLQKIYIPTNRTNRKEQAKKLKQELQVEWGTEIPRKSFVDASNPSIDCEGDNTGYIGRHSTPYSRSGRRLTKPQPRSRIPLATSGIGVGLDVWFVPGRGTDISDTRT